MSPALVAIFKALWAVRASGGETIGIDDLLAACDTQDGIGTFAVLSPEEQVFIPAPNQEFPLSHEASSALAYAGDLHTVSLDELRSALLKAKK